MWFEGAHRMEEAGISLLASEELKSDPEEVWGEQCWAGVGARGPELWRGSVGPARILQVVWSERERARVSVSVATPSERRLRSRASVARRAVRTLPLSA